MTPRRSFVSVLFLMPLLRLGLLTYHREIIEIGPGHPEFNWKTADWAQWVKGSKVICSPLFCNDSEHAIRRETSASEIIHRRQVASEMKQTSDILENHL